MVVELRETVDIKSDANFHTVNSNGCLFPRKGGMSCITLYMSHGLPKQEAESSEKKLHAKI